MRFLNNKWILSILIVLSVLFVAEPIMAEPIMAAGNALDDAKNKLENSKKVIFIISGFLIILPFLFILIVTLLRSNKGDNKYGPEPTGSDSHLGWIILGAFLPSIIGALSVGVIAGYSKAMSKYNENKAVDEIVLLVMNTKTLFANSQNYSALNNELAVKTGIIPEEMLHYSEIVNVYDGNIILKPSAKDYSNDNEAFTITYKNVPQDVCVKLAMADWGNDDNGFIALLVTNNERYEMYGSDMVTRSNCKDGLKSDIAISCAKAMPLQNAVQGCNTNSNTMIFKFY